MTSEEFKVLEKRYLSMWRVADTEKKDTGKISPKTRKLLASIADELKKHERD